TLLVTACLLLVGPTRGPPLSRLVRWLFWSILGLALLAKGGAGLGLVVVVLVSSALVERDARRLRELFDPSIGALFLLGGSWYLVATLHWGSRFVDEQLVGENLHHLLGGGGISDKGSGKTPLVSHLVYYVAPLFLKMLPWSVLLPAALLALRTAGRGTAPLPFLCVWLVPGLTFFTLVSRKSPYYLLPPAPAAAVLAAAWIFDRTRDSFTSELVGLNLPRSCAGLLLAMSILL